MKKHHAPQKMNPKFKLHLILFSEADNDLFLRTKVAFVYATTENHLPAFNLSQGEASCSS